MKSVTSAAGAGQTASPHSAGAAELGALTGCQSLLLLGGFGVLVEHGRLEVALAELLAVDRAHALHVVQAFTDHAVALRGLLFGDAELSQVAEVAVVSHDAGPAGSRAEQRGLV